MSDRETTLRNPGFLAQCLWFMFLVALVHGMSQVVRAIDRNTAAIERAGRLR